MSAYHKCGLSALTAKVRLSVYVNKRIYDAGTENKTCAACAEEMLPPGTAPRRKWTTSVSSAITRTFAALPCRQSGTLLAG